MSGHPGYKLLLDEMWDLHCLKASHYGTAEDPLANLRQSTDIGIEAWRACVGEAKNAFFRVTNHCKNGHLPESNMIDALKDVAAFSMLAVVFLREIQVQDDGDDEEDPEAWKNSLKEMIEFRMWKAEQRSEKAKSLIKWIRGRQPNNSATSASEDEDSEGNVYAQVNGEWVGDQISPEQSMPAGWSKGEDSEGNAYIDTGVLRVKVNPEATGYRPPSEEIGNRMNEVLEKAK